MTANEKPSPRARSLGDEQLLEAMAKSGCPMCRHVAAVAPRYLDSLLYQHTTDRAYRDRFIKGGGFCARHVRDAVVADAAGNGDGVGAAIFIRSQLAARKRALEGAGGFRAGKRIHEASQPAWACPVCENEVASSESAAGRLVDHAKTDGAWREQLESCAWCLTHLGHLLASAAASGGDSLDALRDRQLELMADLDGRLEALAHDSSHGRRDRLTPEVRASLHAAADVLAGTDPADDPD
jgi:hypothetical protein